MTIRNDNQHSRAIIIGDAVANTHTIKSSKPSVDSYDSGDWPYRHLGVQHQLFDAARLPLRALAANESFGPLRKLDLTTSKFDPDNWRYQSDLIRAGINQILGKSPPLSVKPAILDTHYRGSRNGVAYFHSVYRSSDGDHVPMMVLVPEQGELGPNIVALHQTERTGKEEVAGLSGNPQYHYGRELAERGYTVFAPDIYGFGERLDPAVTDIPFKTTTLYEKHPNWSAMGKMVSDLKDLVTLIGNLAFFGLESVAAIGHSLGGHAALFLAALDDRLKTVVANGSYATFASDSQKLRWARPMAQYSYMPQLGSYFSQNQIPVEWHEILSLILPRSFLQMSAKNGEDAVWPTANSLAQVQEALDEITQKYYPNSMGADTVFYPTIDKNKNRFVTGKHGFPSFARLYAYLFLDEILKGSSTIHTHHIQKALKLSIEGEAPQAEKLLLREPTETLWDPMSPEDETPGWLELTPLAGNALIFQQAARLAMK